MTTTPGAKDQPGGEPDFILLENVVKATGCTMEEARSLMMADDDLDAQCEHTPNQVFASLPFVGAPKTSEEMYSGVLAEAKRRYSREIAAIKPVKP